MTGDVLMDRYVLGPLLGTGGMGYVHQARDLKMQREVAVKLLGAISPDGESLRRFSREALAAGSLQHPNVVGVFDTGEQHGRPFLVTELLRGETLREVLRRGPVPLDRARSWAKQLASGLTAAHDKGLIHRDLKPSNIFITGDGWLKILDFGLVKLTESLPQDAEANRVVGTVGYMAPEQVRGQPVDARADLFNFGLVLYEMLCGEPAFADGTDTDTSYAIVVREPKPLPVGVPRDLREMVVRCLAKDREKRPASAREVLRLLDSPASAGARLRRWVLPAAALLVLAAALGTVALRRQGPGEPLAGTIAIFPFDTRALQQPAPLAEGVSELLRLDLADTDLHPADWAQAFRTEAKEETAASVLARARAMALKLGAKYFVTGRAEMVGDELSLTAALYDSESTLQLSRGKAQGKTGEILRLVRNLSDQLQRRKLRPEEFEARVAAFQERTTASVPALTAFLEGKYLSENTMQVTDALAAGRRAIELDPDFTLALISLARLTIVSDWDTTEDLLTRALRHPERLSFAERVHAQNHLLRLQGKLTEASQLLFGAARERPDDALVWRHVGAWLLHRGPFMGRSPQESAIAFQRQFELDPADLEPINHLFDLAVLRGERAVALRLAQRSLALHSGGGDSAERTLVLLRRAWAAGDAAEQDRLGEQVKAHAKELSPDALLLAVNRLELEMDGSALPSEIAALIPVDSSTDEMFRFEPGFTPVAHTSLMRGRIGEARRAMETVIASHPVGDRDFYLPWIDTLELVQPSPAQLQASRESAARLDVTADPRRAPAKQFLLGLLALKARDLEAASAAVQALQTMPEIPRSSIAADLALSLQARILATQGDFKGALATFDRQEVRVPERYFHFYGRTREHFFRAQLLVALGRPREALPLYEALAVYDLVDPVFYPAGQLYSARIHEALGETDRAILGYERFTAMWRECDPEERPELLRAQARLLELRAQASAKISERR